MPTATKPFTDKQKAEIFARDRATCCFSGANLWLLDAPLRVGWQSDWVDHRKPISRGGRSEIENGVCASNTFNQKKRNNSADTTYLFELGHPTSLNYMICGAPPSEITERLLRLSHLKPADWYFNRMLTWIFEAFNYQWSEAGYKRDDDYWFKAAFNKLSTFHKSITGDPSYRSLEERGIISSPDCNQKVLLSLRDCDCSKEMREIAAKLTERYFRNSDVWWEYFHPEDYVDSPEEFDDHRHRCFAETKKTQSQIDCETLHCIESDYKNRYIPA